MVNSGHKVRIRMLASVDGYQKLDLGMDEQDEAVFTLGSATLPPYVESRVARMGEGQTTTWQTPAVRVLGPSMVGSDIVYELTLVADYGRAVSAVDEEHAHHEHGCSCGCDRLRQSLAHA